MAVFTAADADALLASIAPSTDVVIPATNGLGEPYEEIAANAFLGRQITSVTIPSSVTSIGANAFGSNRLRSIAIPNSVTSIGDSAFRDNQLTSVAIPDSITFLGRNAFIDNLLARITISNSLSEIRSGTFAGNRIVAVEIPASVQSIGGGTFAGAGAFSNNLLTEITIPNTVTTLEGYVFSGNPLEKVRIGKAVETLPSSFQGARGTAFLGIPTSFSLTILEGATRINEYAFRGNKIISVTLPSSGLLDIGRAAFADNQLQTVAIPGTVKTIRLQAFENNLLESIQLSEGLESIESLAFSGNPVKSLLIPASVQSLQSQVFNFDDPIRLAVVPPTLPFGSGIIFPFPEATEIVRSVPPVDINAFDIDGSSILSFNENLPSQAIVGRLQAVDADPLGLPGSTFLFSLVNGAGSEDNGFFVIDGNILRIKDSPDYESKQAYSVRVRVTDVGGSGYSIEKAFTFTVNDLPEETFVRLLGTEANFAAIVTNNPTPADGDVFIAEDTQIPWLWSQSCLLYTSDAADE